MDSVLPKSFNPDEDGLQIAAESSSTEQIDQSYQRGEITFVPILYRRAGRGGFLGFLVIVFSVTYRTARPLERTIPSLAATTSTHPNHWQTLTPADCRLTQLALLTHKVGFCDA
jgi:hypothetical protein